MKQAGRITRKVKVALAQQVGWFCKTRMQMVGPDVCASEVSRHHNASCLGCTYKRLVSWQKGMRGARRAFKKGASRC